MNKAFNKVIKSHVLLTVLTVFAAVLLTTGVTYSIFTAQNRNATNQTIAVGNLNADLKSITGALILDDLYPEEAIKITDEDKKYTFTVENSGTFDLNYEIYLMDATSNLVKTNSKYASYKTLTSNYYKYINYKLDGNSIPANLESIYENGRFKLISGTIKAGTSEEHSLQFFLDSKDTTTTGAPNDINGSVISLDIYMDASASNTVTDDIIASAKDKPSTDTEYGVFTSTDDYGTSYYFRGNVDNNYVKFADMYWRILRINGDGTMRLMYDGTAAHANTETSIDRVAIQESTFNDYGNDAKYLGYMFGGSNRTQSNSKEDATKNTTNSTIKTVLDTWYKTNIVDKNYGNEVVDRTFCGDRSTSTNVNTWANDDTTLGYGKNRTVYGAKSRLENIDGTFLTNAAPTLTCVNANDAYTTNTVKGNGALTYPVGLPTVDELALAKGTTSYINKGTSYWTMTPSEFNTNAYVYTMSDTGALSKNAVTDTLSIVPIINLSKEYTNKMLGTGLIDDPYRVE